MIKKIVFVFVLGMVLAGQVFAFGNLVAADGKSSLRVQAVNVVEQGLKSSDTFIRVKAIEVVSNAKLESFLPKVERLMGDDYVPVRFAAAIVVGDMKYSHAKPALKKLMEVGDDTSKIAAAYALAKMGDSRGVPMIQIALAGDDQKLKANAAVLLGKLGSRADLNVLYKVLQDKKASDAAMFSAAEAIARIGDSKIYQRLWTMLISKHPDDRIIGIQAMAALKTSEAKEAVLTMLYDEVLEVRLITAAELGKFGDNSGKLDVEDALTKPLSQIDREALERAYSFKKKNSSEYLENQVQTRQVLQPVYRSQEEYDQAVKRSKTLAALAIGYIKDDGLRKYLPGLLSDSSFEVKLAAAQSVLMRK